MKGIKYSKLNPEVSEIWGTIDKNKDGYLSKQEMKIFLNQTLPKENKSKL